MTVSVWIRPIPCFKLPTYCLHASYSYGQDEISWQYQYEFGLFLASSYRFIVCMPPILMVKDKISWQYQYEFGLFLASSYRFIVCMPPILMVKVKYRGSISMNLAYSLLQVTDLLSACLLFLWSRWNIVTVSVSNIFMWLELVEPLLSKLILDITRYFSPEIRDWNLTSMAFMSSFIKSYPMLLDKPLLQRNWYLLSCSFLEIKSVLKLLLFLFPYNCRWGCIYINLYLWYNSHDITG